MTKSLLLALLTALVLSAGCSSLSPGANPTPAATVIPPTLAPAAVKPADAAPKDAIVNALRMQASVHSYKMLQTFAADDGTITTSTILAVLPDKFQITAKDPKKTTETVIIGDTIYAKGSTYGAWQKVPQGGKKIASSLNFFAALGELDSYKSFMTDVKFDGEDTIQNQKLLKYEYNLNGFPMPGAVGRPATLTGLQKIWLDPVDGLPRRMESVTQVTIGGSTVSGTSTTEYTDYDSPAIGINPPIP